MGPPQDPRRAGHPRPAVRRGVRRHRDRHADAPDGGRGACQGVRGGRAHPHGPGARDPPDPALRLGRDEGAIPSRLRDGREVAGLLPLGARRRLRSRRHAHDRQAGRLRLDHQRHQELDHQRRDRRLLRRLRLDRSREPPRDSVRGRERRATASRSPSTSTSLASTARPPASRCSRTCACRRRT